MDKICCDIVRDLLPGYLYGICSEDSGKLVSAHMEQCPACKEFLQQAKKEEQGKEAAKVDGLRKVRQMLDLRVLLCFVVCVSIFLLMGIFSVQRYGNIPQSFFRISLPLLMLTYHGAFAEGKRWSLPKGRDGSGIASGSELRQLSSEYGFIGGGEAGAFV
ncbi:MAG: zf-HC2 domain-containing protein [Roseburia sp.]